MSIDRTGLPSILLEPKFAPLGEVIDDYLLETYPDIFYYVSLTRAVATFLEKEPSFFIEIYKEQAPEDKQNFVIELIKTIIACVINVSLRVPDTPDETKAKLDSIKGMKLETVIPNLKERFDLQEGELNLLGHEIANLEAFSGVVIDYFPNEEESGTIINLHLLNF